jgi:tricorn protease
VWSPDGEQIAWFNDESGEYGLVIADQDGGNARRIEISEPSFYFVPTWSPDGSKLAFTDTHYRVLVMDVASGDIDHVDTDRYAHPERTMNPEWSPDSRFITYARRLDTQLRVVVVHDTETGETHQLTDGMADAISPVWDASGDYLYFLASTNYGLNTGWLDMTSFDHPVTRALYVAILDADGASPFLPRSDEEGTGEATDAHTAEEHGDTQDTPAVTLDVAGIESRIVAAPDLPLRNYTGLVAGPAGQVFVSESVLNEPGATLHQYSLEDREPMEYASAIVSATVSNDRKKLLMRSGSSWTVTNTAGGAPSASDGHLALGGMRIRIEPQDEWGQMLRDGWRFMRDFLYVDNQHGAPWDDVWQWYSDWLPDVEHRSDFGQLLDMVSAEIAVGHSYVRGGDFPDLTSPRTGLLGADIIASNGGYQISRIYTGENWNPGLTGPLAHAGLGVSEGDYIVAVEGQVLSAPTNPFELLEGTAGRTVRISVNSSPSVEGAREITVEPTGDEGQLRSWAWVEDNRRKVDEMSDGQLAYVWLPNTGQGGYTYFNRMYFAQQDRKGAVIDERNNGGGSAADYIVDLMARELTGYFNSKAGDRKPWTQPMAGLFGPKVMIINERAGSGGDLMPYLFRFRGVGPLVGTRTWGGLVGTWDTPPLLDGGSFVAPRGGFFDVNGEWAIEADGIAPDIEVMNTPKEVAEGRDPQLEAAVAEALRLLETEGVELMAEPAAPVRYRRPGGR